MKIVHGGPEIWINDWSKLDGGHIGINKNDFGKITKIASHHLTLKSRFEPYLSQKLPPPPQKGYPIRVFVCLNYFLSRFHDPRLDISSVHEFF